MNHQPGEEELLCERESLLCSAKTITIASGSEARTEVGVTPMLRHDGAIYIYPSLLAAHARALLESGQASFLIVEDESAAQNIWARRRISFQAQFEEVERGTARFDELCDRFARTHGPTMDMIRDFADFRLLRLLPESGVMVIGFASAFRLEGPDLAIGERLERS